LRDPLFESSRASAPREACGVLLGSVHGARFHVDAVLRAVNVASGTDRFELDPGDIVRAEIEARRRGLELVGFWHSHPHAPAIPSADDERAAWPGTLCVIVSLFAEPAIRAWCSVEGRLLEVPLEVRLGA
jgi:proteasome lid subunit RPN8/RPN11